MTDAVYSLADKMLKLDNAQDIAEYVDKLQKSTNIREIRLSGNTFGEAACAALAPVICKQKSSLQIARLADIFTGRLREEIPPALSHLLTALNPCISLHTLDLSNNAFGPTAQEPLIAFLSSHVPLEHLYLANNGLGPETGTRIAVALTRLAEEKKANNASTLKTLVCGRNRLENSSMLAWSQCFTAHGSLFEIRLPQNGIRPEGIETLLRDGLSNCIRLKVMDLQDNTFTLRGAKALAHVLPIWTELNELGVGDCLLSARGGNILAEAISKGLNSEIAILKLQYNDLDLAAVKALKKAIENNLAKLKLLELNGNKFNQDEDIVDEIRAMFSDRGLGELDDLDDMEEESGEESDADDSESPKTTGEGNSQSADILVSALDTTHIK
ncbi:Ran GTPase-activating protein 1 [Neolecta irregularis DAH-3]|uniref:Ran GTPase-activating protein 1 n=1 Tax=Neolecta irregularis (strain DAH-3) TaxID=1198029 RepID=A0A1U7LV30_NEOID|nr:Ran GTPase-activating protein 1 [Neolecta irregularis DAH-3]|eukprot:OLL26517.1 Ran GTPase-activating protein 1 [Neolecta irregularis DAH-3]